MGDGTGKRRRREIVRVTPAASRHSNREPWESTEAQALSLNNSVFKRQQKMVVLELEAVYAQAAPHTKLLNKRFLGAHHWLGPIKEALVARLAADKVQSVTTANI
ncbi:hypothetical protein PV325_001255 [Microctonus aethiopoides]|nr:hypothetical protein PV325_001255 [Microctonus aethiopoides]